MDLLKENLTMAQERMKKYYYRNHTDREFQVDDMIYLCLQPYRQNLVAFKRNLKLAPRFYGPYTVIKRIGAVAYRLDLPISAKIHPVFHVLALKRRVGSHTPILQTLPLVNSFGEI